MTTTATRFGRSATTFRLTPLLRVGRVAGSAIIVVWGVVTLTFLISRVVSPDPTSLLVPPEASAEQRAEVRAQLGLDEPLWVQYVGFLGALLRGDLGSSFITGRSVSEDLLGRLPATLELGLVALTWGIALGVLLGVIAAIKPGSWIDHVVKAVTVTGMAMPQFWLGLTLISIFFLWLGWFPGPIGRLPIGMMPPPHVTGLYMVDSLLAGQPETLAESARHLVLPSVALGFGVFAPITRVAYTSMTAALASDYVRTCRALGYSPLRIYTSAALKNTMLPVITMSANAVAFAFSGAVLVEGVFGWPGIGQYALNAIQQSDFPALQGFVLYVAIMYVALYALVDILYRAADPRVV
jgi:ABC-type dipeptide/oligopeptide/nickel transport system permease component